jgi:general secretion pathway protein G
MRSGSSAARASRRAIRSRAGARGFTLVELCLAFAIISILAAITGTNYLAYVERAKVVRAVAEIKGIADHARAYEVSEDEPPDFLSDAGVDTLLDPWGNAYQYLKFTPRNRGQWRKDRFLVPINSSFDLYSVGKDGQSVAPLTARFSQDDVIRANDGSYIGLASNY